MFFLKPLTGSEDFETGAIDQQMNRTIREDNVRLTRRRSTASYSAQFFTWNFILGMWWRREELCLLGIEGVAFQKSVPDYTISALLVQQRPAGVSARNERASSQR